jgi:hypothetical protein
MILNNLKQALSKIATQNCEINAIIDGMGHNNSLNSEKWY